VTKFCFVKTDGRLAPADDDAFIALAKIAEGREVIVDIKTARHPKQHRTFFALLKVLVENGERFTNIEQALTGVKIAIGEVDTYIDSETGQVFYVPRSIAFESCDQSRFSEIFDRALTVICDRWLIGTDKEDLREEILAVVEDKRMSSLGKRIRRAA
jgi:hypothetical protein